MVAENASANGTATGTPATTEGMLLAYSSLFIMALIPIYIGAFRSVKYQQAQKVRYCCCCFVRKRFFII